MKRRRNILNETNNCPLSIINCQLNPRSVATKQSGNIRIKLFMDYFLLRTSKFAITETIHFETNYWKENQV
ncbi:MAG: hypothetical protein LBC68_05870 [Prevotellaceae bacterium]|jgi:hypothetical protein|nr:hypothetical protein [Prevotellaceae bacterium]